MNTHQETGVILVVDDNPQNILLLSTLLKPDYKVKAATGADGALKILSKQPLPDLILLDIVMPDMNGFELCAQLKNDPTLQKIPVWFISGNSSELDQVKAEELGALGIMSKPIDAEKLLKEVKSIFTTG